MGGVGPLMSLAPILLKMSLWKSQMNLAEARVLEETAAGGREYAGSGSGDQPDGIWQYADSGAEIRCDL